MKSFLPLLGAIAAVLVWGIIVRLQILDPFFLPHPRDVFIALLDLVQQGAVSKDIAATALRALAAFAIALAVGVPLGLLLGYFKSVYRSLELVIDFFRSTPATAIFPLFLLIFGVGDGAKVAVAAFGAVLIVLFNTAYGVIHSSRSRILAAKVMGASQGQIFRWILFWESLPQTFVGLRSAISLALVVIVVTEMFIGTEMGIGRRIIDSQLVYNIRTMYAAILIAGLVGYVLNFGLLFLERRYIHWSGK